MRRKVVSLILTVAVLLMSASSGYAQSSTNSTQALIERERYVSKTEQAVDEVIKSRVYIVELETNLAATEKQLAEMAKAGDLDKAKLKEKETEVAELRASLDLMKRAYAEQIKDMAKLYASEVKAKEGKRFWRKIAIGEGLLLAAGIAGMVLLR